MTNSEKGFFSIVYDGWLQFAELAGRFNTKLIVSVIYFLMVSVAFVFATLTRKKLLDRNFRVPAHSAWKLRDGKTNDASLDALRHQFVL